MKRTLGREGGVHWREASKKGALAGRSNSFSGGNPEARSEAPQIRRQHLYRVDVPASACVLQLCGPYSPRSPTVEHSRTG